MQPSRAFFIGLPLGLILVLTLYASVVVLELGVPTADSRWCAEMQLKKESAAAAASGPRLLLVGGSSVLFGIKANILQRELSVPTINLGTHAALGVAYMLERTRHTARTGDTVLLAFEYELYGEGPADSSTHLPSDEFIDYVLARDPGYFRALPWREQGVMALAQTLRKIKRSLRSRFRPESVAATPRDPVYDATNLNANGDLTGHDAMRKPARSPHIAKLNEVMLYGMMATGGAWPQVTRFAEWAKANDVRVLAAFPNLARNPAYTPQQIEAVDRALREAYAKIGILTIGTAADAMLDQKDFFDSHYHPLEASAGERTCELVKLLAGHFIGKK